MLNIDPLKVCDIAYLAGQAIMAIYETNFEVQHKEDKSPLTEADLAANAIIKEELAKLTPDIPVLSEESLVDWDVRKQWKTLWIVDPLDGTKEFVNRTDEFTVNIALVENDQPILGVVFAPALDVMYYASNSNGAYKMSGFGPPVRIYARERQNTDAITIVGSRSHQSDAMNNFMNDLSCMNNQVDFVKAGSALKFCLVAEGVADMYPRLAPTSEWDTAAGHVIVRESGKRVYRYDSEGRLNDAQDELVYNKQQLLNPWFICV